MVELVEEYERLLIAIDKYNLKDSRLADQWMDTNDKDEEEFFKQKRLELETEMQPIFRRKKIIELFKEKAGAVGSLAVVSSKERKDR